MMISKQNHFARSWKVDKFAGDFTLWDVWEFPIAANNSKTENFQSFYGIFWEAIEKMSTSTTLAGFLFILRGCLSKILPLDRNINTLPIPGCREITVKSRLNAQDLKKNKETESFRDDHSDNVFSAVYLFKNESLHELSNDTVHALLHLGWIKKEENYYTATLAVYVKPRGILGELYLKLIEPFRHLFVYPAMMKIMKKEWQKYILRKNKIKNQER